MTVSTSSQRAAEPLSSSSPKNAVAKNRSAAKSLSARKKKSQPTPLESEFASTPHVSAASAWQLPNLHELIPELKSNPLNWAIPNEIRDTTNRLLRRLDPAQLSKSNGQAAKSAAALSDWVNQSIAAVCDVHFAYEVLAWLYAWPVLEKFATAETQQMFDKMLRATAVDAGVSPKLGVEQQLLAVELALMASLIPSDSNSSHELLSQAKESLREALTEFVADDGMPRFKYWPIARALLASWIRCLRLAAARNLELLDEKDRTRFQNVVAQMLLMSRPDATSVFVPPSKNKNEPDLLKAAAQVAGEERTAILAKYVLSARPPASPKSAKEKAKAAAERPALSKFSAAAQTALLRSGWGANGSQLAIGFDGTRVYLDLQSGKQRLLSGEWTFSAKVGSELLTPESSWEDVCWISNEEADYLELELQLTRNWRLQRQVLLTREDQIALFAEVLLGPENANIEIQSCLPICSDIVFQAAEETREGSLVGPRGAALSLPLALPEWRNDREPGSLEAMAEGLQLSQFTEGRNLFAPLFLALKPQRKAKQFTWRRLAVAEQLVNQPRDVAAGYRVQLEDRQWLLYRSLAVKGNRTILGLNTCLDFYFGRFQNDGTVQALIEVE